MRLHCLVRLFLVLGLAGCHEQHLPFQAGTWTTFPTDDELVNALVGRGGTTLERTSAELIARDVLVPRFRTELRTTAELRSELARLAERYELHIKGNRHPAPFLWVAINRELEYLYLDAAAHAAKRLHRDLWPEQPPPTAWAPLIERAQQHTAAEVEERIGKLERRYGDLFDDAFDLLGPSKRSRDYELFQQTAMIYNCFFITRTGNHLVTTGAITDVLIDRHIFTTRLAVER